MFTYVRNLFGRLIFKDRLYVAFDSGGRRKPTIILLHGIAATPDVWDKLISKLDTSKYRVIALDMLGFGRSPQPKNCQYNVSDHLKYIRNTLAKNRVKKPVTLVGHSMGAIVAARYGRLHPNEINREYLLSLPLYPNESEFHTDSSRASTNLFIHAYEFLMQNKKFTILSSQNLRRLLRIKDGMDVNERNWDSFRLALKNTIIDQNTYEDIKKTKHDVSVIYGNLDEFLVQGNMRKLAELQNVNSTRLIAVDHKIGNRFAREVARQINNQS